MSELNTTEGDFSLTKLSDACVLVIRRLPGNSHFQGAGGTLLQLGKEGTVQG